MMVHTVTDHRDVLTIATIENSLIAYRYRVDNDITCNGIATEGEVDTITVANGRDVVDIRTTLIEVLSMKVSDDLVE